MLAISQAFCHSQAYLLALSCCPSRRKPPDHLGRTPWTFCKGLLPAQLPEDSAWSQLCGVVSCSPSRKAIQSACWQEFCSEWAWRSAPLISSRGFFIRRGGGGSRGG